MIYFKMVRGENKNRRENQGNFGDGQVYGGKKKGVNVLKKHIVGY